MEIGTDKFSFVKSAIFIVFLMKSSVLNIKCTCAVYCHKCLLVFSDEWSK